MDKTGSYDLYKCKNCGIEGKRYGFSDFLILNENCSPSKIEKCDGRIINIPTFYGRKIQITKCYAQGKAFENLIPDSFHRVISAPSPYKDDSNGVWVMGVGEPVKILNQEYVFAPKLEKSKRIKPSK
jgi:hypothetical protein